MDKTIILKINNIENIKIILPTSKANIYRYNIVNIFYFNKVVNVTIPIFSDCIIYALKELTIHLNLAFNKTLNLSTSILKDIGYLWNRYCWDDDKQDFEYIESNGNKFWIGKRYLLWSSVTMKHQLGFMKKTIN